MMAGESALTRLGKTLLIVLAGVLAMTAAMVVTIQVLGGRGASERDGLILVFEITDSRGDLKTEQEAVRKRLANVPGVTVSRAGAGRIAVWIPYSQPLRRSWAKRQEALEEFRKTQLSPARLEALVKANEVQRRAEMARLVPAGSALYEALPRLFRAADTLTLARRAAATSRTLAAATSTATTPRDGADPEEADVVELAARSLDAAWADVYARSLDVAKLSRMLRAADEPGAAEAVRRRNELVVQYPAQATEILHAIDAHGLWVAAGGRRQPAPEDIDRLLLTEETLEFRIAVQPADLGKSGGTSEYRQALASLQERGPNVPVRVKAGELRWYELDPEGGEFPEGPYVTSYAQGREYLLCYDDRAHRLIHGDPHDQPWHAAAGAVSVDAALGGVTLPFTLDETGAKYLAELTQRHQGRPLALLFDRRVLCAPVIHAPLAEAGIITLRNAIPGKAAASRQREAQEIRELLQLPPLPWPMRRVQ